MATFAPVSLFEHTTGRPLAGVPIKAVHPLTEVPLLTDPPALATSALGTSPQFSTVGPDATVDTVLLVAQRASVGHASLEAIEAAAAAGPFLATADARLTEVESRSGTSVAGSVATFADLPANARDGQSFIVRDQVALYTWSEDAGNWAGPVPVQGAATSAAVAAAVPTAPVKAALDATIDARTRTGKQPVGRDELTINALDYGAKGDGLTNDTPTIQAALNRANTLGAGGEGATVYLPPGRYVLGSALVVPANVALHGAGYRASRLIAPASSAAVVINARSAVRDLHIIGPALGTGVGIAPADNAGKWVVEGCHITGLNVGLSCSQSWSGTLTNVHIQACTTGIRFYGLDNNAFTMLSGAISGCTNGVHVEPATGGVKISFIGVTVESHSNHAFLIESSTIVFQIDGCYFERNLGGSINVTGLVRNLSVSSCAFHGTGAYGVRLANGLDAYVGRSAFRLDDAEARAVVMTSSAKRVTLEANWYATGSEPDFSALTDPDVAIVGGPVAGGTFPRPNTYGANLRLVPGGGHPTAPQNGDMWFTNSSLFIYIGGVIRQVTTTAV